MLSTSCLSKIHAEINSRQLPGDFMQTIEQGYLPVAQYIASEREKHRKPLLVSFNGAQGSGKSTFTAFLLLLLRYQFNLKAVDISIDDFYLTQNQRLQLANDIHPLLVTRGVPGTHDVALAKQTLQCLLGETAESNCELPAFDKSTDDRKSQSDWLRVSLPVDVILFEGWCNHAPVQSAQALLEPANDLEKTEDASSVWRQYVNNQLAIYHHELFQFADLLVFLQVPSFEKVYEWRGLQEKKLEASSTRQGAVMNANQLNRFIQHYERITRHNLKVLPHTADIVIKIDEQHGIDSIRYARDR